MQSKRAAYIEEDTVGSGGNTDVDIDNNSDFKTNFHNIHAFVRIRADNVSADNEAHGFAYIASVPQASVGFPAIRSVGDYEDRQEWIVASAPWFVFGGSTNPNNYGAIQDIEFHPKTSRTLPKGGRLFLVVTSDSQSAKSVIANGWMTCNQTAAMGSANR